MNDNALWHLGYCSDSETQQLQSRLTSWQLLAVPLPQETPAKLSRTQAAAGIFHLASGLATHQVNEIAAILRQNLHLPWIALVDPDGLQNPSIRQLIGAMAFDFHTIPPDTAGLQHSLKQATAMARIRRRSVLPNTVTDSEGLDSDSKLVGNSQAIIRVKMLINRAASTDAPVLITGESGTGKELVARELHQKSSRNRGPFVAVNCGAIPHSLIQSELFGHEKGAFTNATERRIGKVESAHQGTLFLDEIGELPLNQQINFLRFLQDSMIQRVGGLQNIHVDIRIIAATNVDMLNAIQNQSFREDLYYRINVLSIHMPPLRERTEDVLLLAEHFLNEFQLQRAHPLHFSNEAKNAIRRHPWPGNIRELKNRVFKAVMMGNDGEVCASDLELESPTSEQISLSLFQAREKAEADIIRTSLDYAQNNISEASRLLQISRPTLYKLIARYNIQTSRQAADSHTSHEGSHTAIEHKQNYTTKDYNQDITRYTPPGSLGV